MHALLLTVVLALQPTQITRDGFGVPLIKAQSEQEAFYWFGRAVAEDRLWQMEMSRRASRGRLAEVLGRSALASDQAVARTGYTDDEIQRQVDSMPQRVRTLFAEYARGVNDTITARKEANTLPEGYKTNGFEPEPWTPLDSAAIAIRLLQQFGRGGAGELRNYALLLYLKGQPCKDKVFDVIDDLAWQNDPDAVPTVPPADDPLKERHPNFPAFSRLVTEAHVNSLPPTNILELMPAIQLSTGEDADLIAERLGLPYKFGSYAVVVGPERSKTGYPMLLSAPQMGHSDPSVIHEVAIDSPTIKVAGIDVPGVPAVVIGTTPNMAWGLTSGVADVEDVFFAKLADEHTYEYGTGQRKLEEFQRTIKVKGGDPVVVDVVRTHHGPVILNSRIGKAVYSVQSSFRNRELSGIVSVIDIYSAQTAQDVDSAIGRVPVTFNFFYATTRGEFGYRYAGLVPFRARGVDPRFPTPSSPDTEWQGYVSSSAMPHVHNPRTGYLANWNNKPAAWWPNLDTPVWGSPFRNEVLLAALPSGKMGRADLEHAAWTIARRDSETCGAFLQDVKSLLEPNLRTGDPLARYLGGFDGWNTEGSVGAVIYDELVSRLRTELFRPHVGTFIQPTIFETVIQPSVIRKALRGETRYDFLAGRTATDVYTTSMQATMTALKASLGEDPSLWSYVPGSITVRGQKPIPYNNRGTYIQIVELSPIPAGRSVASPGAAESGPHAADQADLARAWMYKPMWRPGAG